MVRLVGLYDSFASVTLASFIAQLEVPPEVAVPVTIAVLVLVPTRLVLPGAVVVSPVYPTAYIA